MSCYSNNFYGNCSPNIDNSTDNYIYTGEDLGCTGIENGDTMTTVLQKLDEKYCEILSLLENCSTTNTTTTIPVDPCPNPVIEFLSQFPITTTTTTKKIECCNDNPVSDILNNK